MVQGSSLARAHKNGTTLKVVPFLAALFLASCSPSADSAFIGPDAPDLEPSTLSAVLKAQEALHAKPGDAMASIALSQLYLQAARESADSAYYGRVDTVLDVLEREDPGNPEAPFLRGSIAAGRHDFSTALTYGKQVTAAHPESARYWGLLADALVETGKYDEAERALQTMSDLRPDYSALTRIAYLREIYGDTEGAIESMQAALEAPTGVPENAAWALAEYARLVLPTGPATAGVLYDRALDAYPGYAPAIAGKARVAMALGNTASGLVLARRALDRQALPEYAALLGDIHEARGEKAEAATAYTLVKIGYDRIEASGTDVDLERVRFFLDHPGLADSGTLVTDAQAVYAERPTIYAADTLAWALHKAGRTNEAGPYLDKALSTGTADPVILFHAGIIKLAYHGTLEGDAGTLLRRVLNESPYFSFRLRPELLKALQQR